jgi:hypothetical protein
MGNWHSWSSDFITQAWVFYLPRTAVIGQSDLPVASIRNIAVLLQFSTEKFGIMHLTKQFEYAILAA